MNQLLLKLLEYATALLIGAVIGGACCWQINDWRNATVIAELKEERAEDSASQSKTALADLTAAAARMNTAAAGFNTNMSSVDRKLSLLQKDVKNANRTPLPADCRLDAVRLRDIKAAADAVNQTTARH